MQKTITESILPTEELAGIYELIESNRPQNHSLLGGNLGLVLYYRERYLHSADFKYAQKAIDLLFEIYEALNDGTPLLYGSIFSSGVAGLAAVTNMLRNDGLVKKGDIDLVDTNEFLFENAKDLFANQQNDFLHGGFGIVHYFSQLDSDESILQYVNELANIISKTAITDANTAWFLNKVPGMNETDEDINFSLSHGLSGMLIILMNLLSKYAHLGRIEKIIQKGVHYIKGSRIVTGRQTDDLTQYPFSVSPNGEGTLSNRLAWCYGDLGPVLLFHRYARFFSDSQINALANEVGVLTCTRQNTNDTLVKDSYFCHGSSGLLQFYNTLYSETGMSLYKHAKEYWHRETKRLLQLELNQGFHNGKETQLLEGLVGVALSFLSTGNSSASSWSKLLLL
jgi:lantibiotic biosynthesis protein